MAKEMEVHCDFGEKQLACKLPSQMMDMLLKVHTKTGEHTFREDVYTCSLKYRMWNNQLRPFLFVNEEGSKHFWKRNLISDDSRGSSLQSVINYMEREKSEKRTVITEGKRDSVHLEWSDLILIDLEAEYHKIHRKEPYNKSHVSPFTAPVTNDPVLPSSPAESHKTTRRIVLVPYKPKPNEWGSWRVKDQPISTVSSSNQIVNEPQ